MKWKGWGFVGALLLCWVLGGRVLQAQEARESTVRAEWSELDDRVRLTPYFGAWFFSGRLDLKENVMAGLRFNYEVPGLVAVSFEYAYTRTDMDMDQQADKLLSHITAPGRAGNLRDDIWGNLHHVGLYVSWTNPDLSAGALRAWMGLGFGMFVRNGFKSDNALDPLPVQLGLVPPNQALTSGGVTGVPAGYSLDGLMFHVSTTVELNYEVSDSVGFGLQWREHFVFSNDVDDDDVNVEVEAGFAPIHELALQFSILF